MKESTVSWRSDKLDWSKLTDTGFTFNVPDSTPDEDDNERAAILSVSKADGSIKVETTRGNFSFDRNSL